MEVIKGKAYWAFIRKPNQFDPSKHTMDIGNLDAETVKFLKSEGVTVRNKGDEKGDYVEIKGGTLYPPRVVDTKWNDLPEPVLLGNGSDIVMKYKPYTTKYKNETYNKAGFAPIMVINLVTPPLKGGSSYGTYEDGYVVGSTTEVKQQDTPPFEDGIPPV